MFPIYTKWEVTEKSFEDIKKSLPPDILKSIELGEMRQAGSFFLTIEGTRHHIQQGDWVVVHPDGRVVLQPKFVIPISEQVLDRLKVANSTNHCKICPRYQYVTETLTIMMDMFKGIYPDYPISIGSLIEDMGCESRYLVVHEVPEMEKQDVTAVIDMIVQEFYNLGIILTIEPQIHTVRVLAEPPPKPAPPIPPFPGAWDELDDDADHCKKSFMRYSSLGLITAETW